MGYRIGIPLLLIISIFLLPKIEATCEPFQGAPSQCQSYIQYPISFDGLNLTQAETAAAATPNLNILGGLPASCSSAAFPFACSGYFRKCYTVDVTLSNGTVITTTLPQQTCKSVCDKFVSSCPLGSQAPDCSVYPPDNATVPTTVPGLNITVDVPCVIPTSGSVSVVCVFPLRARPDNKSCDIACPLPQWSTKQWKALYTNLYVGPWIGFFMMLFAALTYTLDPAKRIYPANLLTFFAYGLTLLQFALVWPVLTGHRYPHAWCTHGVYRHRYWINVTQAIMLAAGAWIGQGYLVCACLNLLTAVCFQKKYFPGFDRWWAPHAVVATASVALILPPLAAWKYDIPQGAPYAVMRSSAAWEFSFFWGPLLFFLLTELICVSAVLFQLVRINGIKGITYQGRLIVLTFIIVFMEGLPITQRFYAEAHKSKLQNSIAEWAKCTSTTTGDPSLCKLRFRLSYAFTFATTTDSWMAGVMASLVCVVGGQTRQVWADLYTRTTASMSGSLSGEKPSHASGGSHSGDGNELSPVPGLALAGSQSGLDSRAASRIISTNAGAWSSARSAAPSPSNNYRSDSDENNSQFELPVLKEDDSVYKTDTTDARSAHSDS